MQRHQNWEASPWHHERRQHDSITWEDCSPFIDLGTMYMRKLGNFTWALDSPRFLSPCLREDCHEVLAPVLEHYLSL